MANSPFAAYVNFTASFTVAGDALEQDARGNWRPSTATVAVTAVVEQAKDGRKQSDEIRRPGVDSRAIYLKGYLVEPRPLPASVTPISPCSATYNGLSGSFVMDFTGRNPYLQALGIDLVDEIKGWFLPNSFT